MNIGLYITELLEKHDYVIIPGFGAFLTKYKPAQFDKECNLIYPPARDVVFNPDLKINDGVLMNHIAHREGITAPKAYTALESIRQELYYTLDHGETVCIEGIGSISREGTQFRFEPDASVCNLPGAFGLIPVETVGDHQQEAEISFQKQERKKKPGKPFSLWYLLIPAIAAIVVIVWFFAGETPESTVPLISMPGTPGVPNTSEEDDKPKETAFPADSLISENTEIEEEPATQDTVQAHPVKGVYYLIGGSFKSRENAEKYMVKARKTGHEPIYLGETGNFHLVALAVFSDENEAFSHQNRMLRNDSSAGVWIYSAGE